MTTPRAFTGLEQKIYFTGGKERDCVNRERHEVAKKKFIA